MPADTPKGFAGLDEFVSKIEAMPPKARQPAIEPTTPASGQPISDRQQPESESAPNPIDKPIIAGFLIFVLLIVGAAVAYFAKNPTAPIDKGSTISSNPQPTGQGQTVTPSANVFDQFDKSQSSSRGQAATPQAYAEIHGTPRVAEIITKHIYTLRGSDGSTVKIEGPANATAAELNKTARANWRPADAYVPEDRPPVGDGLLFTDNQIKYCLSQKIRLTGWNLTVESHDHQSVDSFNAQVTDFNARCHHYQYHAGAFERVRAEVEARRAILNVDGRLHRGPRPPPALPTYRKVSMVVEQTVIGTKHARCAGSYEMAKCEALATEMDNEPPQQKLERQRRLDAGRN